MMSPLFSGGPWAAPKESLTEVSSPYIASLVGTLGSMADEPLPPWRPWSATWRGRAAVFAVDLWLASPSTLAPVDGHVAGVGAGWRVGLPA